MFSHLFPEGLWSKLELDLIYLGENYRPRLSVQILNLPIDFGDYEKPMMATAT